MFQTTPPIIEKRIPDSTSPPILICLLGTFRLFKGSKPIAVRGGGKTEALLAYLSLRQDECVPRDVLLQAVWPDSDMVLAGQSLRSLLHSLQRQLGDAIGGAPLVVHSDGCYHLNMAEGIGVDVAQFDALVHAGDRQLAAGDPAAAATYRRAITLYRGDLHVGDSDLRAVMAREHMRAHFLALLMRLATHLFNQRDYRGSVELLRRLLSVDPCFENAHRLLMRCYVRLGERSVALHQYRLCTDILQSEFDITPEPDTNDLYEQIRLDPSNV